ncbi:MAG: ABC transporter permease [Gammaproteobacteria bacterium]|nr:ABC transporter permease [Gammaproteobacteria bacterium]
MDNTSIIIEALVLISTLDENLIDIISTSLTVSITAVFFSCIISIPVAVIISIKEFTGKNIITTIVNGLMGLPPVVVGLFIYLLLSYQGPLAAYNLLYTVWAMVIAQFVIVTPIIIALSKQTIDSIFYEYKDFIKSIGLTTFKSMTLLIWETRDLMLVNGLAGLGRAFAEVGAVIIVGGNIAHETRVLTTSIALETSRGDLVKAMALGLILILLSILISTLTNMIKTYSCK